MKYVLIICVFVLFPGSVHADISITEIAWMGIPGTNGQYGEWIELYNDSSEPIDLTGWKILKSDGKLLFTLSKTIAPHSYLLVERKTASIPDPVEGIDDEINAFSNNGLSNEGEDISIIDKDGNEIQSLAYKEKWPAGNSEKKHTMQWDGSEWITLPPTPKMPYKKEEGEGAEGSAGGGEEEEKEAPIVSANEPMIEFIFPKVVHRGISYLYEANPILEFNYRIGKGVFEWNMGDGTTYAFTESKKVAHTYQYPGTYYVSFIYKDPSNLNIAVLEGEKRVEVHAPDLILRILDGSALEIQNKSSRALDLSGWKIQHKDQSVLIPPRTILGERAKMALPFNVLGISGTKLWLYDPSGRMVAQSMDYEVKEAVEAKEEIKEVYAPLIEHLEPLYEMKEEAAIVPIKAISRTKTYVFSAAVIAGIGLFLLLQRFKAQ